MYYHVTHRYGAQSVIALLRLLDSQINKGKQMTAPDRYPLQRTAYSSCFRRRRLLSLLVPEQVVCRRPTIVDNAAVLSEVVQSLYNARSV